MNPKMHAVELEISVADQLIRERVPGPGPNRSYPFQWYGKDAYGSPRA